MTPASIPDRCDVLIIGAGPAGLFAADHLQQAGVRNIVVIDKGRPMTSRVCPDGPACDCRFCDVLEGEGGAGSFSDGKLTLSATRGTHGQTVFTADQEPLMDVVDTTVRRFIDGVDYPPPTALPGLDREPGLRFEAYPLLHVGSDGIRLFGQRYAAYLRQRGVTLLTGTEATDLHIDGGTAVGAAVRARRPAAQETIRAGAVIAASGMMGTPWLEQQLAAAGVHLGVGPADIGVRVETTAAALDPFIAAFYDFKVSHTSPSGIVVRSFCVNGNGYVVNEYHRSLRIRGVNGHSFLDRRSGQSNLAVLATIDAHTHPDPTSHVRDLARRVNAAAGGYPMSQPLAEFAPHLAHGTAQGVRPSNPKTRPGRLDYALPAGLYQAFTSYLDRLGRILPPVLAPDTMIYAPEIKYYNRRVPIDSHTWGSIDIGGLFVVGNAAGYTASLSAAALSGIIAGRACAHHLQAATR